MKETIIHKALTANFIPAISALLLISAISPFGGVYAMHHLQGEEKPTAKIQIEAAEQVIEAFYSFDSATLAPLLRQAGGSSANILYYQGWAEGGNYKVVTRTPCFIEEPNKIACAITVQDDPVVALNTGFNVTDTFHMTFDGANLTAVETSSNDQPIYYEARQWVEANRPEVMTGPCKDAYAGGTTPGDCARAMTEGYTEFYKTVVVPRSN
ncbi:MAG: hypothetical protein HOH12_13095 [Gammaproteobacteria bacterium]|jgi:hypothetical protein|nr:hypothetical protein [Gammaproteobacteria bacterium]